jgi:hypothetical protein
MNKPTITGIFYEALSHHPFGFITHLPPLAE